MKNFLKKACIFCLGLILVISIAQPAISVEGSKTEKIQELLELTMPEGRSEEMVTLVINSMKPSFPGVPEEFWSRAISKFSSSDLNDLLTPIYDQYFSDEELDAMIEFNRSAIGQSINSKMPLVTQESYIAGQRWGERIATEVLEELATEGFTQ
ncbi:MAG: DUF2059 domain-containing protein [Leptolyngbyaceae cyanobacterium MAG.088]|nr:DUF2059 domain-containing protein [Leptolyngbyaceae cyanobacterium MAG.088]